MALPRRHKNPIHKLMVALLLSAFRITASVYLVRCFPLVRKLKRFCAHLADTLHHSTIKVYLSAVRSPHIEEGLPDPLVGCLELQRVLQGIKHHQGSNQPKRQPITSDLMLIIYHSLDFSVYNHPILWAACCIGFFGFLQAGEFTVNVPFNPAIHLTVNDIQAHSLSNTKSFGIHIKCSKTDPFRQGCYIYISTGRQDLCPVQALVQYLHLHGIAPGPLFHEADGSPFSSHWLASSISSFFSSARVSGCFLGHSFHIGAALVDGQVTYTNYAFIPRSTLS